LRKPIVGVLANIYEASAGIQAGGHLHFIEVVKRWVGVEIVVFAPEIARRKIAVALPNARFVSMPALAPKSPKALDFLYRSLASIRRVRELKRCDAMLATSHLLADIMPAIISGKPAAVISHHLLGTDLEANGRKNSIPNLGERFSLWAMRFADVRAIITSSALVGGELRARGLTMPIVISTNGVDHTADVAAVDISANLRDGAVFIGRIHPSKNVNDAIRSWRIVVDRHPDARLTIIGPANTPSYLLELEGLIAELKLEDSVILAGSVDDAEKWRALARARVFLFPSGQEGFGIALAEAMRAGLPCVTYDLPIFAEIFPAGRLEAPLGDYVTLARRVNALLDDEALRLSYAAEASKLAETFSWERASRIAAGVFAEILRR
jgi:glycosyltransferase involved in cell wall biosynthesis